MKTLRHFLSAATVRFGAVLTAFLLFTGSLASVTSCSEKADPEIPAEPGTEEPEAPKDWTEKVMDIYEHASIGPQEVRTVHQLAILTSVNASLEVAGPISVTPCLLNGKEMTLVTLGGTQMVEGQATGLQESQLAAFGKTNDYLKAVIKLFEDGTVPAEKPVLVTGISLGGMIAQQLTGVESVLASHQIYAVISYGSPFTLPLDRHGVKVVRFVDVNDKVPQMGESVLRSGMVKPEGMTKDEFLAELKKLDQVEKITATSQYSGMLDTHSLSYISEPCWDVFDILGNPVDDQHPVNNVLVLQRELTFYAAPKL